MMIKSKRLIIMLAAVLLLLLIPFVAMYFTAEVNWTISDFAVAALLLAGIAICCEFVMQKVKNRNYSVAICVFLLACLAIVWLELAVGIFS